MRAHAPRLKLRALRASTSRPLRSKARALTAGTPATAPAPFLADQSGSSMIEMAVTLPVLMALLFCMLEICLAFYSHDLISELAREGTRYAMVHGASCPTSANPTCEASATDVNNYVSSISLPNLAGGTMTVHTTYPDGNEAVGSRVQVSVTYVFPITMHWVPTSSVTMTSTSQMRILQ